MQPIIGKKKLIGFKRLKELQEGLQLIISNLSTVNYRGKERYILKFENIEECYCSNFWLEKEIKDRKIDLNFKIKVKLDKIKTTPNKNKERMIFIA